MLEDKEMRAIYCDCLIELAKEDPDIVIVDSDLSRAVGTMNFTKAFPERSFDVGIAEANMIGVAAGLAAMGKKPFAHSFTPFSTRRCFDQVTVSVAYTGLNVKIVGADPGISAELNGGTHMSVDDAGMMRGVPNMIVFEPVDGAMLRKAMPQIVAFNGPLYIRLYRKQADKVFDDSLEFTLGKAITLRPGKDAVIFASGIMVSAAIEACATLANDGLDVELINIHTLKPLDAEAIIDAARRTGAVVTAENHSILNGLGSAVCEVLAESCPTPVKRVGMRDHFGEVGKRPFLAEKYGMTAPDIVAAVKEVVAKKA